MLVTVLALCGCAARRVPSAPAVADAAGVVTVSLSDFAFEPERLSLHAGQPVRLHLVNTSGGGHDFSAPKFFAASRFAQGSVLPKDGAIEVPPHGAVDTSLTPLAPGQYDLACTHPLHELFGMSGTIDVQ